MGGTRHASNKITAIAQNQCDERSEAKWHDHNQCKTLKVKQSRPRMTLPKSYMKDPRILFEKYGGVVATTWVWGYVDWD